MEFKKSISLICTLLLCSLVMGQTIPTSNIQKQVVFGIVTGSTPDDPNAYFWHESPTTIQGVVVDLRLVKFAVCHCRVTTAGSNFLIRIL